MKLRGLAIAVFLLAALTGVLYWSNHRQGDQDPAVKASPDAPVKVLSLDPTQVVRLSILRPNSPQVELSRDNSGNWQITAPQKLAADQDSVAGVLSTLSSLTADRLVDDHATELAEYGLGNPAVEVSLTTKDNKTQRVLVGAATPAGGDYYLSLGGDTRLFTFATYSKSALDKTWKDLRDKRLLTADFDSATQIDLLPAASAAKQDITFARDKDAWQIVKPQPARADSEQMDALMRSLKDAKMDVTSDDDKANAAAFASAAPFATAKVTGPFGTQELDVRKVKDKEDYYAKSSALPGIYKLASADEAVLKKSPDDFRAKSLFDFGFEDPDKIEVHDGAKAYFLSHSGSDWWGPDGKKLDVTTVQALLSALRRLSATSFPVSGFATPSLDITVTSNGGKRTEKVLIAKNGDLYTAKRENEPGLYSIPTSSVTDLQQSAAGIKPASTRK